MVSREKRYELNLAFRALVYARDEQEFMASLDIWEKQAQGVEVRIGAGEQALYVSLSEYYEKNWASVQHMWARFERKALPLGEEHTNNRLERTFGVLKADLKMCNTGDVTIEVAVLHIIAWAERKLVEAYTQAQRKEMQIYDRDPEVQQEYKKASVELNDTGCLAFRKSMELMKKCESKMIVVEEGVREKFSRKKGVDDSDTEDEEDEYEEKTYKTSVTECSCTRWHQDCFACRHILFLRRERKLPLFTKEIFAEYFFRERNSDLDVKIEEDRDRLEIKDVEPDNDDHEDGADAFVLEPEVKFTIARDLTSELRELLCYHGTEQFTKYMWELEVMKRRVRRGLPMMNSNARRFKAVQDTGAIVDEAGAATSKNVDTEDSGGQVVDVEAERFEFEKIIRKKGRPKHSGAGKLQFPKPKRTSTHVKKPSKGVVGKVAESVLPMAKSVLPMAKSVLPMAETVVLSDTEVSLDDQDSWTQQICLAPPVPGQIGDNVITKLDYASLAPGSFVTASTVNWWLRLLDHQYAVLGDQDVRPVLVLSTEFYQQMERWDPAIGVLDENLGLQYWTERARLWQGGSRLVILPACWRSHFYALVAVLDPNQPMLYILESLGGQFARIPPFAKKLCSFLQLLRTEENEECLAFKTVFVTVPRQKPNSNNCGMFCLKFIELILERPEEFEQRAKDRDLSDWFPVDCVDSKRMELIQHINQLASDQRQPGGEMAEKRLALPLLQPSVVYKQVNIPTL